MSVWLDKKDYKAVKDFSIVLAKLIQNRQVAEKLKLNNKAGGLLAEVYSVLRLHEEFADMKIAWRGGTKEGFDIALHDPKNGFTAQIQVKKMTGYKENEKRYYWVWRKNLNKFKRGKKLPYSVHYTDMPEEIKKKFNYPYLFVYIGDDLETEFFCLSSKDSTKALKTLLKRKTRWLKVQWKTKREGNLTASTLSFHMDKPRKTGKLYVNDYRNRFKNLLY